MVVIDLGTFLQLFQLHLLGDHGHEVFVGPPGEINFAPSLLEGKYTRFVGPFLLPIRTLVSYFLDERITRVVKTLPNFTRIHFILILSLIHI